MNPVRACSKLFAPLSWLWLACCLFFVSAAAGASAEEPPLTGEAILYHNFRPIVTFRASVLGASPAARARRSAERIDNLTPAQMVLPVEITPITLDGVPAVTLTAGGTLLFGISENDLDPQEKLSLEQVAESAQQKISAALQADAEQRQPKVLLVGFGLSAVATVIGFALLWLIARATRLLIARLQSVIEKEDAGNTLRWARHRLVARTARIAAVHGIPVAERRLSVADLRPRALPAHRAARRTAR
ncbi:hypothetical protein [Candidatus Accumulibacter sp. ACC003]|uniref:hypothetical protein n=1 Tax=Candidatus Accumulibacter sp. ACC003 TaxID=2823334 RepID=UPI0025C4B788|nr:hypothetical protein [Candidatus Accumulibacter sp. ACC003]